MFISTIAIKGDKIFKDEFKISLNPGLNIILGENASGKSAVIDAIRLALQEDEYGRTGISASDFHRPSK
jgi:putative ATP-dependent endonuclease of the OLD family